MGSVPDGVSTTPAYEDDRRYAKLAVRIRAVMYDTILFFAMMLVMVSLAIAMKSDIIAKVIGAIWALLVLLYEPVMVWLKGGTLGHMACNLRIVDDRTLGNPSLLKATARYIIKTILGWLSLLTVMPSRRKRAVHDLLTSATVQNRNARRIKIYDFVAGEIAIRRVSILKRLLSVVIYSILLFAFIIIVSGVLYYYGLLSDNCIEYERCSFAEYLLETALGWGWLLGQFEIVAFGWHGRLYGFRAR